MSNIICCESLRVRFDQSLLLILHRQCFFIHPDRFAFRTIVYVTAVAISPWMVCCNSSESDVVFALRTDMLRCFFFYKFRRIFISPYINFVFIRNPASVFYVFAIIGNILGRYAADPECITAIAAIYFSFGIACYGVQQLFRSAIRAVNICDYLMIQCMIFLNAAYFMIQ